MTTVREIADELEVPVAWVIRAFLPRAMKTVSSKLTDDEVALIRKQAVRWRDDPPPRGFVAYGSKRKRR